LIVKEGTMGSNLKEALSANIGSAVLLLALAGSLGLNVSLGRELQRRPEPTETRMAGLQKGTTLPSIEAKDLSGRPVTLSFSGDPQTVVYVLSPLCGWCKRNEPNIVALGKGAAGRYRFIGLSTNGDLKMLNTLLKENPLPFEVYWVESTDVIEKLDLGVTPQTALLNAQGVIQQAWQGAYLNVSANEIESTFKIALPGLRDATRSGAK
jgi:hypothetical protein